MLSSGATGSASSSVVVVCGSSGTSLRSNGDDGDRLMNGLGNPGGGCAAPVDGTTSTVSERPLSELPSTTTVGAGIVKLPGCVAVSTHDKTIDELDVLTPLMMCI